MDDTTSMSRNMTLEEINNQIVVTLSPAIVIVGILMVVGVVGNGLVCYVFCRKMPKGAQNFLIVCLSVFDLISCTVVMPTEIVDMKQYYVFESEMACRMLRFLNVFTALSSIFTLLVIAVDRYKNVLRPFQPQMTVQSARYSLILVLIGSLLISWPALVLYGIRSADVGIPGIRGRNCSTCDAFQETIFPLIYNAVQFIGFVVVSTVLIVAYVRVLRETRRHFQYIRNTTDFYHASGSACLANSQPHSRISEFNTSLNDHFLKEVCPRYEGTDNPGLEVQDPEGGKSSKNAAKPGDRGEHTPFTYSPTLLERFTYDQSKSKYFISHNDSVVVSSYGVEQSDNFCKRSSSNPNIAEMLLEHDRHTDECSEVRPTSGSKRRINMARNVSVNISGNSVSLQKSSCSSADNLRCGHNSYSYLPMVEPCVEYINSADMNTVARKKSDSTNLYEHFVLCDCHNVDSLTVPLENQDAFSVRFSALKSDYQSKTNRVQCIVCNAQDHYNATSSHRSDMDTDKNTVYDFFKRQKLEADNECLDLSTVNAEFLIRPFNRGVNSEVEASTVCSTTCPKYRSCRTKQISQNCANCQHCRVCYILQKTLTNATDQSSAHSNSKSISLDVENTCKHNKRQCNCDSVTVVVDELPGVTANNSTVYFNSNNREARHCSSESNERLPLGDISKIVQTSKTEENPTIEDIPKIVQSLTLGIKPKMVVFCKRCTSAASEDFVYQQFSSNRQHLSSRSICDTDVSNEVGVAGMDSNLGVFLLHRHKNALPKPNDKTNLQCILQPATTTIESYCPMQLHTHLPTNISPHSSVQLNLQETSISSSGTVHIPTNNSTTANSGRSMQQPADASTTVNSVQLSADASTTANLVQRPADTSTTIYSNNTVQLSADTPPTAKSGRSVHLPADTSTTANLVQLLADTLATGNSGQLPVDVSTNDNSGRSVQSRADTSTNANSVQSRADTSTNANSVQSPADTSTNANSVQSSADTSTNANSVQSRADTSTNANSVQSRADTSTNANSVQSPADTSTNASSVQSPADTSTNASSVQSLADTSTNASSGRSVHSPADSSTNANAGRSVQSPTDKSANANSVQSPADKSANANSGRSVQSPADTSTNVNAGISMLLPVDTSTTIHLSRSVQLPKDISTINSSRTVQLHKDTSTTMNPRRSMQISAGTSTTTNSSISVHLYAIASTTIDSGISVELPAESHYMIPNQIVSKDRASLNQSSSASTKIDNPSETNPATHIAVAVTTVFILSFLPHLCLMLARFLKPSLYHELSDFEFLLYCIFLRSYLANSVLNPFVYGWLNRKFRHHCYHIIRTLSCCH